MKGSPGSRGSTGSLGSKGSLGSTGCVLLILLAGVWAYWDSFGGVFLLDDVRAIVRNETIRTLAPLSVPLSPPSMATVSGRPVANLTFALNFALSSVDPVSYHAANLAIHLLAALALFAVARRTLRAPPLRERFESASTLVAFAITIVWVVHPLTTAAVTYIVQRVESLMALFYLLTLYCAIRAADRRRSGRWTLAAVVVCALGMATKEVMVTAPVTVALWFRVFRPDIRIPWRLVAAIAAAWIVFGILLAGERREASIALTAGMSWRYLLTQAEVLVRYLRLAFVPAPLIFLYTWPLAAAAGAVALPAALILVLLLLSLVGIVKRQPLGFLGAAFFVILAPTSSAIPIVTEVAAEHRMYLPLAAVVSATVGCGYVGLLRVKPKFATWTLTGAAIAAAIALGVQTRDRNRVYGSEQQVWADTVAKDPDNQRARVAYGSALATGGRIAEAEAQFQRAVELNDADAVAQARLGSALAAQDKFEEAVPHLERALAVRQDDVEAHRTLGRIYALKRDDAKAVEHLESALKSQPDDPQLLVQVASLRADSRAPGVMNPERAAALAERAVRQTNRREATALDVLGLAYARQGRFAEAVSSAQDALAIARAAGNHAAAADIQSRLQAYESRLR